MRKAFRHRVTARVVALHLSSCRNQPQHAERDLHLLLATGMETGDQSSLGGLTFVVFKNLPRF